MTGAAGAVLEAAALVLGVLGLLCAVLPFADPGLLAAAPSAGPVPAAEVAGLVGVLAWPLAAVGLAAGTFGIARAGSERRGVAVAGTVLSALGLVLALAQLPAVTAIWPVASAAVAAATPGPVTRRARHPR
ncbi:hypothetical protein [Pseudonocardia ammonioxydans]|uniref:hypothetical protein n=1 Tax=Pseudonocardia ammonioxydans TaxID=260086 RepID=UPI00116088C0|nr:hypothetical protein [Pseudonocardia ammonioxydans]